MKTKYKIIIALLLLTAIMIGYRIINLPIETRIDNLIDRVIQSSAVFVALLAAVIALSATDLKAKKVKVKIEQEINLKEKGSYEKVKLPPDIQTKYKDFPDPITSHRVHFKITNTSGFTLNQPTLTFRLPLEKRHPHLYQHPQLGNFWKLTFNSNLYNSQSNIRVLEFEDTSILSNSNLPFWNHEESITIWIRMLLNDGKLEPFTVDVSINCENAEGITKKVTIKPKQYNLEAEIPDTADSKLILSTTVGCLL